MKKIPSNINIDELSVKDALVSDIGALLLTGSVVSDPVPIPFLLLTPMVAGKRIINKFKKTADLIKK